MTTLAISEVFGPTFQGEGPSLGRRAGFVRLGRCNLDCGAGEGATWRCDTPYTWDWAGKLGKVYDPKLEVHKLEVDEIARRLERMNVPLVVLTGGEPMLQHRGLKELCRLVRYTADIEMETNGTMAPPDWMNDWRIRFNVSPKLANSGVARDRAWNASALRALRDTMDPAFKFVATVPEDLEEVDQLVTLLELDPESIWVMPSGTSTEELERHSAALLPAVLARCWNLTTRLHVQLWGDRRGV